MKAYIINVKAESTERILMKFSIQAGYGRFFKVGKSSNAVSRNLGEAGEMCQTLTD